MIEIVLAYKDEENQKAIPTVWRSTIGAIVEAIKTDDFELLNGVAKVVAVSKQDGGRIKKNIEEYGCQLTSLPHATWETSVCQWVGSYWDALIDLLTVEEGLSDLALSVRVYEKNQDFEFEIMSVHVS